MKKLEEIQLRKTISSYGGCGTIVETLKNGSLLIEPYDTWKCYSDRELPNRKQINNSRLLDEVKKTPNYADVNKLVDIPTADLSDRVYKANANDTISTIKSRYFPEWFFCPKCRELHRIKDWEQKWQEAFGENNSTFKENPPACYHCSSRGNNGRYNRKYLQQIRFAMASLDTGQLTDIPFDLLWDMTNDGKAWIFDKINVETELSYHTSQGGEGLQSVYIMKGRGANASRNYMSTIYNKYLVFNTDRTIACADYSIGIKKGAYRVVLRNGTNLCFPSILNCIYIPKPSTERIRAVRNLAQTGLDARTIYDMIGEAMELSLTQIEETISFLQGTDDNDNLRMEEFNYITNPLIYKDNSQRIETDFHAIRYPNLNSKHIKGLYALTQLKETSVLLGYTRISNGKIRWWDINQNMETEVFPGFEYPFRNRPTFMPAVEAYGEGLLFEIDSTSIPGAKCFEFIHTFCHLIMKELEFSCGYPVTSIKERIYWEDNNTNMGFLIYTIQGAEGSYGGLTSLMPSDTNSSDAKILKLIDMAVERAQDCPNDPICSSEDGHCFACVDLPETSCERFNDSLNRTEFLKYY